MTEKKRPPKPTLEELRKLIAEANEKLGRQHGRAGKENETEEQEYKRLYNNWKSRESRDRKKKLEKHQERSYRELFGFNADEDEYGIRLVDERRYRACFKSAPIGSIVYRDYVKRMTGLTKNQIYIMQQRTGLVPHPAVTKKEADADEKRRWETGDYF